jgi:V/A-type H+-transporting ATPase subunit I
MLRPQACRWFELIALREDLAPVLEALANAGAIELQSERPSDRRLAEQDFERLRARFRELDRAYRAYWPLERGGGATAGAIGCDDPVAAFAERLTRVEAWRTEADPIVDELERTGAALRVLADLDALFAHADALPDVGLLAADGDFVAVRIYALDRTAGALVLPADMLCVTVRHGEEDFVVLAGRRIEIDDIDRQASARKARRIVTPAGLQGEGPHLLAEIARRRAAAEARQAELQRALRGLDERFQLTRVLTDLERIDWLIANSSDLAASDRLVWVTGWTTARDHDAFCAPLGRLAQRCVVHFPIPPSGAEAPALLINRPFVRGFERFARLLGQPGRDEADPSALLALFAPLLFGFMFGDVGQGAVLCGAGLLLRRRAPLLGLLVPGGAAAMVFGFLFGSVFARGDLIHPLWLDPLRDPVTVLVAALVLGAVILLAGLVLDAVQAAWRGEGRTWWKRDAGFVVAYLALLSAAWRREMLWLAPLAAAWYLLGALLTAPAHRLAALGRAAAQFVERGLQLFVNTLSFARVGAFALAHAGLSAAVVGLGEAAGGAGYWLVLVVGNVLILALEGLVVGIQTTRLLLFEFFARFLRGTGRAFRPLAPPFAAGGSSIKESR